MSMKKEKINIKIKTDLSNQNLKSDEGFSSESKEQALSVIDKKLKETEQIIKKKSSNQVKELFAEYIKLRGSFEKTLLLKTENKDSVFFD